MAVIQSRGALEGLARVDAPSIRRGLDLYVDRAAAYETLYRSQANVRLVTRFLGRNIGQLSIGAFRRVSRTEREEVDPEGQLAEFLRLPNSWTVRHAWVRAMVEDLAVYDYFVGLKLRNAATGRLEVVRVPPRWATPQGGNFARPAEVKIAANATLGGGKTYPIESVLYLHGHNLEDQRLGCSPLEAIRQTLAEEMASGEWREQLWRSGARRSGWIQRPLEAPKWGPDAKDRFVEGWRASYTGSGIEAGGTPVLEDGMVFHDSTFSAAEAEYLASRKLSREEVAAAYFIPPVFVGILENANFANIREQHRSLYADTLGPWVDWIEQEMALQVVPEFVEAQTGPRVYVEFDVASKLRGSFEEESTALQTAVGAPHMTRNEARAYRNLPPVDGGDDLVVPLNVLIGGQASPTDSAPPPEGAAATRPSGAKARPESRIATLGAARDRWAEKHLEVLTGHLDRQREAVLSRLGAGQSIGEAFDRDRWAGELADDLLAVVTTQVDEQGSAEAIRFGGLLDLDRCSGWIGTHARIVAEKITDSTLAALEAAVTGVGRASRRGGKADLDEFLDDDLLDAEDFETLPTPVDLAGGAFSGVLAGRLAGQAMSLATEVDGFARREGAEQSGARVKVWYTTSSNTRHGALEGEEVPIGDYFSNGARWPGDSALDDDERAGCQCAMDFVEG